MRAVLAKIGVFAAHHPGIALCVTLVLMGGIAFVVSRRFREWVFETIDQVVRGIGRLITFLVKAAIVTFAGLVALGIIYVGIEVIDAITPAEKAETIKVCIHGCNSSNGSGNVNSFLPIDR